MKTILIVDDSAFTRAIHAKIVSAAGHRPLEANDGQTAVEAYRQHQPDVVLVDLLMPDMDGLEVIRQILELDPEAKTVVCSTDKQQARQNEARQIGVNAFLTKPVNADQLTAVISSIFEP